mmetsp:Transcript_48674/g.103865  ORF Transcript_48674/g.103865 Transcript_48674/m.103865 type:complete len:206 (-) Transcript_48674:806-1423(-)
MSCRFQQVVVVSRRRAFVRFVRGCNEFFLVERLFRWHGRLLRAARRCWIWLVCAWLGCARFCRSLDFFLDRWGIVRIRATAMHDTITFHVSATRIPLFCHAPRLLCSVAVCQLVARRTLQALRHLHNLRHLHDSRLIRCTFPHLRALSRLRVLHHPITRPRRICALDPHAPLCHPHALHNLHVLRNLRTRYHLNALHSFLVVRDR